MVKTCCRIVVLLLSLSLLPSVGYASTQPSLAFAVISDIHITDWNKQAKRKLQAALADLRQINSETDALVINGDLGDGRVQDYHMLNRIINMKPPSVRLFYTIGNHEFYKSWYDRHNRWNTRSFPNGESESSSIGRFLQLTGETHVYYDKWVNGYHFVFMGSERYRQSEPENGEDAYISQRQLDWLEKRLSEQADAKRPIFVFLHQPLNSEGSGQGDGYKQREKLRQILNRFPQVIMFNGHTHRSLKLPGTIVRERFTTVNSSSVYQPYRKDEDPAPQERDDSEGLYVEAHGNQVIIRGRDFTRKQWISATQSTIRILE